MGEAEKFLLLPPPPPLNLPGLRRSRKISATTPPPTESARLTAIPENFCYYPPPPTECGRPPEITENCPPPQKKILATPLPTHTTGSHVFYQIVSSGSRLMEPCLTSQMLHLVSHRAPFWDIYSSCCTSTT